MTAQGVGQLHFPSCLIPTLPPPIPVMGVVGHTIDSCIKIENDIGMWVKLSDEGMVQLGLAPVPSAYALALAYSKDRKQEFLEEKEVYRCWERN